jgi:hypothetical protein
MLFISLVEHRQVVVDRVVLVLGALLVVVAAVRLGWTLCALDSPLLHSAVGGYGRTLGRLTTGCLEQAIYVRLHRIVAAERHGAVSGAERTDDVVGAPEGGAEGSWDRPAVLPDAIANL